MLKIVNRTNHKLNFGLARYDEFFGLKSESTNPPSPTDPTDPTDPTNSQTIKFLNDKILFVPISSDGYIYVQGYNINNVDKIRSYTECMTKKDKIIDVEKFTFDDRECQYIILWKDKLIVNNTKYIPGNRTSISMMCNGAGVSRSIKCEEIKSYQNCCFDPKTKILYIVGENKIQKMKIETDNKVPTIVRNINFELSKKIDELHTVKMGLDGNGGIFLININDCVLDFYHIDLDLNIINQKKATLQNDVNLIGLDEYGQLILGECTPNNYIVYVQNIMNGRFRKALEICNQDEKYYNLIINSQITYGKNGKYLLIPINYKLIKHPLDSYIDATILHDLQHGLINLDQSAEPSFINIH